MQCLVGDIGGTKTVLAQARIGAGGILLTQERRWPSRDFPSLEALLGAWLAATGVPPLPAALAVAGPVSADRCQATNLPWRLDGAALAAATGLPRVHLLNDLEAVAWGLPALTAADYAVLQAGDPEARGNACVVAAGTGLGQAGLYWDGQRHQPVATEGGHADFAPADPREWALLGYLQRRFGHVSWERVVSGMGIANLYEFLRSEAAAMPPPAVAAAEADAGEVAAAVAASVDQDPWCAEAMTWFSRLYGREAGNVALKHLALGGVWLAGGIAPKNLPLLRAGGFLAGFRDKGRMAELMTRIPVRVILNQQTPLLGAARYLADRAG